MAFHSLESLPMQLVNHVIVQTLSHVIIWRQAIIVPCSHQQRLGRDRAKGQILTNDQVINGTKGLRGGCKPSGDG